MADEVACMCKLRDYLHEYILSEHQLQQIHDKFMRQIQMGLSKDLHEQADVKCYHTYVQDLPTGDEQGKYLALDLGGSNFRVVLIHLMGKHSAQITYRIYAITRATMTGPGQQLFDHIARCLLEFTEEMNVDALSLPLGFTFSFPCQQMSLTKAVLVRWTKGFTCSGVEGEDVGQMLIEAIKRQGLTINVLGILNDTTGTLMSCAHQNPDCRVGLIVGTGTNTCYVERTENCERLAAEYKRKPYMLVNTEWGAFGDGGDLEFIRTDLDRLIDEASPNAGYQTFEKMVSGMYLGNLTRLILKQAVRENLLFCSCCSMANKITNVLVTNPECIQTRHISEVEADKPPDYPLTRKMLKDVFNLRNANVDDIEKFRYICEVLSKRSGQLVGVCLSGIINKIGLHRVVIGVDGTVFRCHPKYPLYMNTLMDRYVNRNITYKLMLSEDGSGRGASLVAAVVSSRKKYNS